MMKNILKVADSLYLRAQIRIQDFARREREKENGDHLFEVLGTIIVAVLILFIFKDQLTAMVKKAFDVINENFNKLFDIQYTAPTGGTGI